MSDLFDHAIDSDRKRLREAGFLAAPGVAQGQCAWKLPGSDRVLSEREALALLERMEANRGSQD